jgi:hypothetical protein
VGPGLMLTILPALVIYAVGLSICIGIGTPRDCANSLIALPPGAGLNRSRRDRFIAFVSPGGRGRTGGKNVSALYYIRPPAARKAAPRRLAGGPRPMENLRKPRGHLHDRDRAAPPIENRHDSAQ